MSEYNHPVYRDAKRRLRGLPCHYCGKPSNTIEHLKPIALGGTSTPDNLVAACSSCNYSRGAVLGNKLRRRRRRWRHPNY